MKAVYLCLCMLAAFCFSAAALPADCSQVIVGSADGWNSSHVQLSLLEKGPRGWVMVKGPFPARLGKAGLVWGRGVSMPPSGGPVKKEGDLRSPAGIFELGGVYGTVPVPQKKRSMPYRRITPRDMWVDDPASPLYNQHFVLKHDPVTPWEFKQQMKLNDYAHSLKLFIRHNAASGREKPVPGAGSSIFFHIWRRDGGAPTAGVHRHERGKFESHDRMAGPLPASPLHPVARQGIPAPARSLGIAVTVMVLFSFRRREGGHGASSFSSPWRHRRKRVGCMVLHVFDRGEAEGFPEREGGGRKRIL